MNRMGRIPFRPATMNREVVHRGERGVVRQQVLARGGLLAPEDNRLRAGLSHDLLGQLGVARSRESHGSPQQLRRSELRPVPGVRPEVAPDGRGPLDLSSVECARGHQHGSPPSGLRVCIAP